MTAPLRIVHAVRSTAFAGVEQFILRLAIQQSLDGHVVHVIGGDAARMREPLDAHSVTFSPASRTVETARAIGRLAVAVDVVNAHMTAADVAAVMALGPRRAAKPVLVSTRHFMSRRGRFAGIPIDNLVGGRIDSEIAISHAVAHVIGRRSTVVHSGIASDDAPDRPRGRTVLMAQRLEAEKRTEVGVRAFVASGLAHEGWTLEIAGDGAERPRLEALATRLGAEARFLGFRDDLPTRYRTAGLLLAPCPVEGFGLAVIEAMSRGLPVTAADSGAHREILGGLDGRALHTPEDPDAAGRALASLGGDPFGRAALGMAGRERQRAGFSITAQAQGTEAVYRAAIAAREARWSR
jgi:glycosyltransferase involved in cell wall biosynthesis